MNNKTHEVHFRVSEEIYEYLRKESGLRGITINAFLCGVIGDMKRSDEILCDWVKKHAND